MKRDSRTLVRAAFDIPRAKGKPDWTRMSIAVLKNRILDLTDREFRELDYGAGNFLEFLNALSDIVRIDQSTFPPSVELLTPANQAPERAAPETVEIADDEIGVPDSIFDGAQIRSDLWAAVIDWKEDASYLWDAKQQRVCKIPRREGDIRVIPRITRSQALAMRAAFAEAQLPKLTTTQKEKLEAWVSMKVPLAHLPGDLASRWRLVLTRHIEARLQEWIAANADSTSAKDRFRERGDTLAVGEMFARQWASVDSAATDYAVANAIGNWASVRPLAVDVGSIRELIESVDKFAPAQIAIAVAHVASRLAQENVTAPRDLTDLAYRVSDSLAKAFAVGDRTRKQDVLHAAVAKLDEAFAGLQDASDSFCRTTAVTAKKPSVELVKQVHRYATVALQNELPLLREIETLLGPVFRKFCEACERHLSLEVIQRIAELRVHIDRVQNAYSTDTPYPLWTMVLSPILAHTSAMLEEGIRVTEQFTAPNLLIVGGAFKLDLNPTGREVCFPARLRNDGQGVAYGLQMSYAEGVAETRLRIVEPAHSFDLAPKSERLITLGLTIATKSVSLALHIKWGCVGANGKTFEFGQQLNIEQQLAEPQWDELQRNPPYVINPIKDPAQLYGRRGVIEDLTLQSASGTSTFLWGQKRVGKTSVLQVLAAQLSQRDDIACVILRMGELAALHEGQIAHTIATRICESIGRLNEVPPEEVFGAGLGRLVPFVERLSGSVPGQKFVVIIDEFDDLDTSLYSGERGRQFVKALRSLSEVGLTFFFVGSERMNAIYQAHAGDLNKWVNYSLDCLSSSEDCAALIAEPVRGSIEYHPDAIVSIARYCDGNPFYMHLLCGQIFRRCVHERRTYVSESDVDDVRRELLRVLGPTNFAHFWEDNPELQLGDKWRQAAENCVFLSLVASLGGAYDSTEDLIEAQDSLQLTGSQRLARDQLRKIEARLLRRKVLRAGAEGGRFLLGPPIFRDWVTANAEAHLLPIWRRHIEEQEASASAEQRPATPVFETTAFPIAEDDLLPVSQKLVFLGKQVDVAEVRSWLRQFDDDSRIEVAFQLLRRLSEQGYVSDGVVVSALTSMQDAINERRTRIGGRAWLPVRRRLDNLCISYVDSEAKSGAQTARELSKRMAPGKCAGVSELGGWVDGHLESDPIIVIADDFAGTGTTLTKGIGRLWKGREVLMNRLAKEGRVICAVISAFPEAVEKIHAEYPSIDVLVIRPFGDEVRALDPEARIFADDGELKFAKDVVLQIGRQLTAQNPLGYGDMGALVAFHNGIPNNSLPIFWSSGTVNHRPWTPLLSRASF